MNRFSFALAITALSLVIPSLAFATNATDTRTIVCKDNHGNVVDDSLCIANVSAKPPTTKPGAVCPGETYAWSQGGFGACSVSCGGGTQTQAVTCKRNDGVVVDDSYCTGPKPATSQSCNTNACAAPPAFTFVSAKGASQQGRKSYVSYTQQNKTPSDLQCSGSIIAGSLEDSASSILTASPGFTIMPTLQAISGARCVVHYRVGYTNDSKTHAWSSVYYNGDPRPGATNVDAGQWHN